jgi:FixJ family two-component response regulator
MLDQGPISSGSIFLYFPLRNPDRATPVSLLRTPLPNIKQPLIAIVDDDESVCRALKRLIRSLGMTAETYVSSSEFVDLIEALPSFQPDCVVLDVQMPGMSGIEVQASIRKARGAIPVIFITAHDDRIVREQALAAGAVAFLRKPFNDALLIRTLAAALGRDETGLNVVGPSCGE